MKRDLLDFLACTLCEGYVFGWDNVPGKDNKKLIEFLDKNFDINWIKTAKLEKTDIGKTIRIYAEEKSLSLKLTDIKTNDEALEVILAIDDSDKDEFIADIEDGELNIYEMKKKIYCNLILEVFQENEKEILTGKLHCPVCQGCYSIEDGIPNMLPPEYSD